MDIELKKKKKKKLGKSVESTDDAVELEKAVVNEENASSEIKKKKKKRKLAEDESFHTPSKTEFECIGESNDGSGRKKKKRKKSTLSSDNLKQGEVLENEQNTPSEKKKKKKKSKLSLDGSVQTPNKIEPPSAVEEPNDVENLKQKSKKKRRSSAKSEDGKAAKLSETASEAPEKDSEEVETTPKSKSSKKDSNKEKKASGKKSKKRRSSVAEGEAGNANIESPPLSSPVKDPSTPCDGNISKDEETNAKDRDNGNDENPVNTDAPIATKADIHPDSATGKSNADEPQNRPRRGSVPGQPFKRVREDNVEFHDERLRDNSFYSKFDTYGEKAHNDLSVTRGKGFRKEKTKKKRLNHHGGKLSNQVNSFKFPDDSD